MNNTVNNMDILYCFY